MPAYVAGTAQALYPGDLTLTLFNAETVTAPQSSIAFVRAEGATGESGGVTFVWRFASAPATASVLVQASNSDVDADYFTLYTSTNTQQDNDTETAGYTFYRMKVAAQSGGGAITATVNRF